MVFTTKDYVEINKDFILSRVSEFDIFRYYIPELKSLNTKISSPFRRDRHPSCSIKDYGDSLLLRDFATGENYTFTKLVECLYGCDYTTSLKRIATDLGLVNLSVNTELIKQRLELSKLSVEKEYSKIHVKVRDWNKSLDYDYWNQYGITLSTLKRFKVFPLETYWLNSMRIDCKKPTYAYYFGNNEFKILSPFSTGFGKWCSNSRYDTIQGYNQLPISGDLLIITSSLKDVMLLHELGYTAIAPQAESYLLPKDRVSELKNRFTKIILFYDNDGNFNPEPGTSGKGKYGAKRNSEEYNLPMIFLPEGEQKDISDYYKEFGRTTTVQIMKELIDGI